MNVELYKMQDKRWVIRRKDKSYAIKNIESIFVYLLAFGLKFQVIEDTVVDMEMNDFNIAKFSKGKAVLEKK